MIKLFNGKTVSKEDILKWIKALRSGDYKQGKNTLQDHNGYCCLGVACDIFIPKNEQERHINGYLMGQFPSQQPKSPEWLKHINEDFSLKFNKSKRALSQLNDLDNYNFKQIADELECVYIKEHTDESI